MENASRRYSEFNYKGKLGRAGEFPVKRKNTKNKLIQQQFKIQNV